VDTLPTIPEATCDETLLDWFLALDPGQRLAELESRLSFINSARPRDDAELSPNP
jgi:hypothetical protein